jgi:hypothetical protein
MSAPTGRLTAREQTSGAARRAGQPAAVRPAIEGDDGPMVCTYRRSQTRIFSLARDSRHRT